MARYLKNERQAKILELINVEAIPDVKALMERLKEVGFDNDDKTIYRDVSDLGLVCTVLPNGQIGFRTAAKIAHESVAERMSKMTIEASIRVDKLNNYVKVQCMHGCSEAVATAINRLDLNDVFCSLVARDDVLIVCKSDNGAERVFKILDGVINK